jgi:apolipoprotein N-acyltransferase
VITDAYTPQVFPWFWGNFLAEDIRAAQFAEYVGAYGLSAILFVGNLFLYQTIRWLRILKNKRFILNSKKLYIFPILFLIMIAILELGGNQIIKNWESKTVVRKTNVAIIQPDGPLEFRDGRNPRIVMDELLMRVRKLTSEVANGRSLDLIVLPESGIPFFSANPTALNQINQIYWSEFDILMRELSTKYNANVFFNELDMGNSKTGRLVYYNSSVLYDRQGMRRQSYQKSYLLMFGEYMPFEFLYDLSPQTGNFEPGIQLQPISYYSQDKQVSGSFVPLICYEVIIPEFVRSFDRIDDFDFFVNVTNDKWYGPGRESYEHLTLARLRAIEHRRWIVRSTNSGTSAFVDHLGRIVDNEFTPLLSSAAIYQQVPSFKESPTFYSRFGDLLVFLFLGLGMAIIGFLWTR